MEEREREFAWQSCICGNKAQEVLVSESTFRPGYHCSPVDMTAPVIFSSNVTQVNSVPLGQLLQSWRDVLLPTLE